jgi:hypothetical protein
VKTVKIVKIQTYVDRPTMSRAAARHAAQSLRAAIGDRGDVPSRAVSMSVLQILKSLVDDIP